MIEFKPGAGLGCWVRIWLDEFPFDAVVPPLVQRVMETLAPAVVEPARRTRVAVEVFQPRGARSLYGLLGGEFARLEGNELVVVIPCGPEDTDAVYANSLAGKQDHVVVGHRHEFAAATIAGVRDMQDAQTGLPVGTLSFSCMAHGAVGSAPLVFRVLARVVVCLLQSSKPPDTAEEVESLIGPWR